MLDSDGVTAGPIAFVLSGGGSIGSIQVGMLHALRIGLVALAEASVLVVVSAPHREAAFAAARFCIDVTKECVPVWKHEHRGGRTGPMSAGIDIDDVQRAAARWDTRGGG